MREGNQRAIAIAALSFFQTDAHYLVIQSIAQMFAIVPLGTFSLSKINPEFLAQIAAGSFVLAVELVFPVLVAADADRYGAGRPS